LLSVPPHHAALSFPTRRSSDLRGMGFGLHQVPGFGACPGIHARLDGRLRNACSGNGSLRDRPVTKRLEAVAGHVEDAVAVRALRSEEHTSELQSRENLVCRLLL